VLASGTNRGHFLLLRVHRRHPLAQILKALETPRSAASTSDSRLLPDLFSPSASGRSRHTHHGFDSVPRLRAPGASRAVPHRAVPSRGLGASKRFVQEHGFVPVAQNRSPPNDLSVPGRACSRAFVAIRAVPGTSPPLHPRAQWSLGPHVRLCLDGPTRTVVFPGHSTARQVPRRPARLTACHFLAFFRCLDRWVGAYVFPVCAGLGVAVVVFPGSYCSCYPDLRTTFRRHGLTGVKFLPDPL